MGGVAKAIGSLVTGGGGQKVKPPEPVEPPPAATPPTLADANTGLAAQNAKGKAAAGALMSGTVMTTPRGLTQKASKAYTSLLGGSGDDA